MTDEGIACTYRIYGDTWLPLLSYLWQPDQSYFLYISNICITVKVKKGRGKKEQVWRSRLSSRAIDAVSKKNLTFKGGEFLWVVLLLNCKPAKYLNSKYINFNICTVCSNIRHVWLMSEGFPPGTPVSLP